ncbi:NADH oxidoreductase [Arenicella chitinivorans]|uniref:NADH oxidoreductase n=1 Tax=Arenicella chitinivorans TaxID=1329800 RepID=A0A918RTM7_9GAMM|nr:zinc-binding dehydrogenase [Arenicella chitinivorans]GHA10592.1 NADH oxidoreductase [Arenicella chitinivorans]
MKTMQQLFSTVTSDGQLKVNLVEQDVPTPKPHEVLVKMEAAPINPSDMWPMFGPADLSQATYDAGQKALLAPLFPGTAKRVSSRLDQTLPIGNEGAGTVVATGDSDAAKALMGKTVGLISGATYANYCCVPVQACIAHHADTTPKQAASSFVNPLTALGMVDTMRMEGHTALVHTAAASSLGQMLNKICLAEDVPLVNIVRKAEQQDILRSQGAKIVLNSSDETFKQDLYNAIDQTGATLGFDAIGGGELVSDILTAMERVGSKDAVGLNTYGSLTHKQVYLYGSLDISPTILNRAYGMSWGIGGWLLMRFLSKVEPTRVMALHKRVADEISSTFANHFSAELSLEQALQPENVARYNAKKTGEKYLINPSLDA